MKKFSHFILSFVPFLPGCCLVKDCSDPASGYINPVDEIKIKGIPDVPCVNGNSNSKPAVFMTGGHQIGD